VLADRALNGVQEVVYYHGEEVATRTRYDSRLLLAHLARLDRIAGTAGVHATVRDFDREVERLLDPPELYDWDDEDEAESWEDERWQDEDGEDAALEDEEEAEDAQADGDEADADADGAEADGAEAQAAEQAAADGAKHAGTTDGAEDAADALSEGGSRAGSGAAGFASLDSVSCVSNRRCGEGGGADARGGFGGGAGEDGDGGAGGDRGQGSAGPSCRVLHH
jgi:hypothetical protein